MSDIMYFTLPGSILKGTVFVRRPVSDEPPNNTVCFVDDGTATGWQNGQSAGVFKYGLWTDGRGHPLKFKPTYWTTFDDQPLAVQDNGDA